MTTYNPIPESVLAVIEGARPSLAAMCRNYRAAMAAKRTMQACQIGKALADNYCNGEAAGLSGIEVWLLAHHCLGSRTEHPGYGRQQ